MTVCYSHCENGVCPLEQFDKVYSPCSLNIFDVIAATENMTYKCPKLSQFISPMIDRMNKFYWHLTNKGLSKKKKKKKGETATKASPRHRYFNTLEPIPL